MPDAVFVGGGAIGLACAWRAAQAGLRVVVADDRPGEGASSVAAGMLAPVTETHFGEEALLGLNLAASARYPSFVGEVEDASGMATGYETYGTLAVARDGDEDALFRRLLLFQRELGLNVERLRGRDCRSLEPGLAPGVRSGLLVSGDHRVDAAALTAALRRACERAGVIWREQRVASILVTDNRARGVALVDGTRLACGQVVLCAGCWSGGVAGIPPEARVPVRPVKGQLLHLRTRDGAPAARLGIRGPEIYVVPRADGRVVIGATVEEQGFDVTVTASAIFELLRAAYELMPGVVELDFLGARAGLRPGTPDNAPILGPTAVEGLIVATGHFRNGILLTPVTADAIAHVLSSGGVDRLIAPFSPERFGARERVPG
jgi:glycine oxidase